MMAIVVEGTSGMIEEAYFKVIDDHPDADWVSIQTLRETKNELPLQESLNALKAHFDGTGHEKAKITFDNMEGCPAKTQQVLVKEFQRILDGYPQLKYSVENDVKTA